MIIGVRADIVCSSLTKIFSGRGDVLAGSLIINSHTHTDTVTHTDTHTDTHTTSDLSSVSDNRSVRARQLVSVAGTLDLPCLYLSDAVTLENNSRTFLERCSRINVTGQALAVWLREQEGVGCLYYSTGEEYESVMRTKQSQGQSVSQGVGERERQSESENVSGYGCLMSIVLSEGWNEKQFFDNLHVSKGPSLGTNFTIACPYTLLAHYFELDWAAQYGVDRRLIRVSVGMEDIEVSVLFFSHSAFILLQINHYSSTILSLSTTSHFNNFLRFSNFSNLYFFPQDLKSVFSVALRSAQPPPLSLPQ